MILSKPTANERSDRIRYSGGEGAWFARRGLSSCASSTDWAAEAPLPVRPIQHPLVDDVVDGSGCANGLIVTKAPGIF